MKLIANMDIEVFESSVFEGGNMRTEDQIKRKINELKATLSNNVDTNDFTDVTVWNVTTAKINVLEWVLNNPHEKYHQ